MSTLVHEFACEKPLTTDAVEMGILSPETIRRMSVVEVNNTLLYCKSCPMANGILDLRLGTSDRRFACATCNKTLRDCAGHSGHIELGVPIFLPTGIDVTMKALRSVCYYCSRLLHVPDDSTSGKQRFLSRKRAPEETLPSLRRRAAYVQQDPTGIRVEGQRICLQRTPR